MNWICSICSKPQQASEHFCSSCLYSRPLDRKGIPQIFAGFCIHFNGVIPRILKHPSHAVEWRMAERHGAMCSVDFDDKVNLLVYRPGYERSDKCRRCISSNRVSAVPIIWMLDSLLETRQISISFYRLTAVPEVAKCTTSGSSLPHYEHPFFLLKAKEYAIPSSFPMSMQDKLTSSNVVGGTTKLSSIGSPVTHKRRVLKRIGEAPEDGPIPPFFEIHPLTSEMIDVYESALNALNRKAKVEGSMSENDFLEDFRERKGVEIIASAEKYSKVDTMLFSGMTMMLSSSLVENRRIPEILRRCGANILSYAESPTEFIISNVTHIVYHRFDKKSDFLVQAAHVKATKRPGLVLCESTWLEDCLMLGEVIPPYKVYNPSSTLMETLNKRYGKRNTSG